MTTHRINLFHGQKHVQATVEVNTQEATVCLSVMSKSGSRELNVAANGDIAKAVASLRSSVSEMGLKLPEALFDHIQWDVNWKHHGYVQDWTSVEFSVDGVESGWKVALGDYNEATQLYRSYQGHMEGHWYLEPLNRNALYVVANDVYGDLPIEGPDTPMRRRLEQKYEAHPFEWVNHVGMAFELGLVPVEFKKRGFSSLKGLYILP